MSRKKPGPRSLVNAGIFVGAHISPELNTRLEVRAVREMRSKAQMLRIYIERGLKQDMSTDKVDRG